MRALVIAAALVAFAGEAAAYHEVRSFPVSANFGGGAGYYYTGSPRFKGYTCALCHTGGEGRASVSVTSDPAELTASGTYTPGQTYRIDVELIGEHRGLGSAFNPNTFTAEVVDQGGAAAGALGVGDDPVVELTGGGQIAIAEGFGNGETTWSFFWSAPDADGPLGFYLALLDGDGASDPEVRFIDPFNDDVATFTRTLCRRGAECAEPPPEPEPESPASGCQSAPGGGPWWLAAVLLAVFWRRGARGV